MKTMIRLNITFVSFIALAFISTSEAEASALKTLTPAQQAAGKKINRAINQHLAKPAHKLAREKASSGSRYLSSDTFRREAVREVIQKKKASVARTPAAVRAPSTGRHAGSAVSGTRGTNQLRDYSIGKARVTDDYGKTFNRADRVRTAGDSARYRTVDVFDDGVVVGSPIPASQLNIGKTGKSMYRNQPVYDAFDGKFKKLQVIE